jgi:hypothetical protein
VVVIVVIVMVVVAVAVVVTVKVSLPSARYYNRNVKIKHALYSSARDSGEWSGTRSERLHPESVISTELLRGG